jgi:hypothetical protein
MKMNKLMAAPLKEDLNKHVEERKDSREHKLKKELSCQRENFLEESYELISNLHCRGLYEYKFIIYIHIYVWKSFGLFLNAAR